MGKEAALKQVIDAWQLFGVEIDAQFDDRAGHALHISRIEVPRSLRNQGYGSRAMEDLATFADDHGLAITLSPTTDFGASSKERLRRFYKRFGFVQNKGKHKDFRIWDTMYRRAQ